MTVKKAGKTLTKEQAKDRIEEACRAHGLVTPRELVQQLWDSGEYSDSGLSLDEIMAYVDEDCSWFQTAIPKTGIPNGDYFPSEFEGASGYRIVFVRESEINYIFTCYRY